MSLTLVCLLDFRGPFLIQRTKISNPTTCYTLLQSSVLLTTFVVKRLLLKDYLVQLFGFLSFYKILWWLRQ